jgi:hypothetical protein
MACNPSGTGLSLDLEIPCDRAHRGLFLAVHKLQSKGCHVLFYTVLSRYRKYENKIYKMPTREGLTLCMPNIILYILRVISKYLNS